ncbi:hypothetical protein [Mycobacterium riyadhense]|uniref:hypothetical protein n=1 Tax=Mycobacterium riyadhense TaxID=486698 RepID=UPI00195111E0|nr:hypothetical protein [Mycobacterium riyadhense]
MGVFLVALVVGVIAFSLTANAFYKPKPPKPRAVTIGDVWASIARAQATVDDGYRLIYGKSGRE